MKRKALIPVEQALIPFHGGEILAVRLLDGLIGAALVSLCNLLKIAKWPQLRRIREDEVLSKHLVLVIVETPGGPQATEVLLAPAIPFWLTGLQPSMVAPEKRPMILALKEEAVEVLYRHFFHIDPTPPPQPERPKAAPHSPVQMIAGAVQTIGEAVQMLEAERQEIRGHLAALEQWREITEERQQAMGEYLVETRERVKALEQRRDDAPLEMAEDDRPVGKTLLSPQHLGQVYVLAREERRRSGEAISALLAALAREFGVPDVSDLPDSAWNDVLGWFWERQRRG